MYKKVFFLILLSVLLNSCADDWSSVKRGLTGAKSESADEFFVKKKEPLILPPDYENLPMPKAGEFKNDETSDFEKSLNLESINTTSTTATSSTESEILKKIKKR
tara:strand:- start:320 stop:634 length:315 start_codon:yes stop_codon:yes gene_type:complete